MYPEYKFIAVGDTYKSEYQTLSTHRGVNYIVSHVFKDNGKMRVFIKDKDNKDIEVTSDYRYSVTSKTVGLSDTRQIRARLDYFWDNPEASFVFNPSWHYNFETTEFFELSNRAYFCGDNSKDVIARISRYKKRKNIDGGWQYYDRSEINLKSKQEYYDYFKTIDMENFKINGLHDKPQFGIDMLYFMNNIPYYDESLLDLGLPHVDVTRYIHSNDMSFEEYLKLIAESIFDEDELSDMNKQTVYNIVEAFELLPKSFGPTSVSKLLLGKEKKQNKTVEHLSGTCTNLKQIRLFALCDMIDSYLYHTKIFITKDEYGNGDEWRDAYEFIGSKMIDLDGIKKIKNKLK